MLGAVLMPSIATHAELKKLMLICANAKLSGGAHDVVHTAEQSEGTV